MLKITSLNNSVFPFKSPFTVYATKNSKQLIGQIFRGRNERKTNNGLVLFIASISSENFTVV